MMTRLLQWIWHHHWIRAGAAEEYISQDVCLASSVAAREPWYIGQP